MFVDCSVGDVSTVHGRYKVTNNWGWAAWQFLLGFPFWRSSFTQPQEAAALAGFDKQPHLWPGTFGRSPGLTEVGSIWQCAPWRRWDGGWLVDWHSLVFSILLSWQLCLSGGWNMLELSTFKSTWWSWALRVLVVDIILFVSGVWLANINWTWTAPRSQCFLKDLRTTGLAAWNPDWLGHHFLSLWTPHL